MYRFRLYLTREKREEELYLDAFVYENFEYETLLNVDRLYENLLKEGLSGGLSVAFLDENTRTREIERIGVSSDLPKLLENISVFLDKWYNMGVLVEDVWS